MTNKTEINPKSIIEKIKKFRDDRDWMQFYDHKNMAISLVNNK